MKSAGIKIVCIGVVRRGSNGYKELQQIASNPKEVTQLQVNNVDQLRTKLLLLLAASCPPAPPPGLNIFVNTASMAQKSMEMQCNVKYSVVNL